MLFHDYQQQQIYRQKLFLDMCQIVSISYLERGTCLFSVAQGVVGQGSVEERNIDVRWSQLNCSRQVFHCRLVVTTAVFDGSSEGIGRERS